jgi:hypothetical protein
MRITLWDSEFPLVFTPERGRKTRWDSLRVMQQLTWRHARHGDAERNDVESTAALSVTDVTI